jgi:hypothetical protein
MPHVHLSAVFPRNRDRIGMLRVEQDGWCLPVNRAPAECQPRTEQLCAANRHSVRSRTMRSTRNEATEINGIWKVPGSFEQDLVRTDE